MTTLIIIGFITLSIITYLTEDKNPNAKKPGWNEFEKVMKERNKYYQTMYKKGYSKEKIRNTREYKRLSKQAFEIQKMYNL